MTYGRQVSRFHKSLIDFMLSRYRNHDYGPLFEKVSINSPICYTQNGDTKYVDIVLSIHSKDVGEEINGKIFLINVQPYLENAEETLKQFKELKRHFSQNKIYFFEKDYRKVFQLAVYPSRRNFIFLKKHEKYFLSSSEENTRIGFPFLSNSYETPIGIYPVVEEEFEVTFGAWKKINKFIRNFHKEFPETPRVEEIV